jgi:DNA-binding response OmpR family regulator
MFATRSELLESFEASLPDVLLLDMKMGADSGGEVLEVVRKRWPKLCVIVVTGYPSMDTMRVTFKQDVYDYVAKPFSIADLRRVLTQAASELGLGLRPQDRLRAHLGFSVRQARSRKGLTLKELSDATGISVSQISAIERGTHLPSMESFLALAAALGEKPSGWLAQGGF